MGRVQSGYVYEASRSLFVRYWSSAIVDGKVQRVQRSEHLCDKNDKYYISQLKDKKTGKKKLVLSSPAKLLRNEFMQKINTQGSRRVQLVN